MIYLLKDCYKDENGNFVDILKIGYSSKPFKESRENQYKTHNYGFKLLQEREGDAELENYLHKRFSKYLLPDSYEWFYYNEEIINGFNVIQSIIVTTKEKYVENIKYYLLRELKMPGELYKIHKNTIIEELQNYPEYNKNDEDIYDRHIRKSFKLWYTLIKDNIENNCILSNPYFNDIPEEIEEEWLEKNPWKTRAILYFNKTLINFTEEQSKANIDAKEKRTLRLLKSYEQMDDVTKQDCADKWSDDKNMYMKDYICMSSRTGKATYNYLVKVAEERAFDVSRKEYQDDITIKRGIESIQGYNLDASDENKTSDALKDLFHEFKEKYESLPNSFEPRMKCIYDYHEKYPQLFEQFGNMISTFIPRSYENYINTLGFDRIRANSFHEAEVIREIEDLKYIKESKENNIIDSLFSVGSKYTTKQIKETLGKLYKDNNISKTPKASDLEEYFELKSVKLKNLEGKWEHGFEIVNKK